MLHHGFRNYSPMFSLARYCFLVLSLSLSVSGSALALEWKEYISVCENATALGKKDTTIRTSGGILETQGDFIAIINSMIEDGWEPFGGPYTVTFVHVSVCQVMVRNKPGSRGTRSLSELRQKIVGAVVREVTPEQCYAIPTATCLIALVQETAKLIEDNRERTMLFATVAVVQAQVGYAAAARRSLAEAAGGIAESETPDLVTLLAHSYFAVAQAQLGDATNARENIVEAFDIGKRLGDSIEILLVLPEIAAAQRQIGDVAAARQSIDRLLEDRGQAENLTQRTIALALIAAAQAQVGDIVAARQTIDRALQYAGQIEIIGPRTVAFALIASAQVRFGDTAAGRQTITDALDDAGQIEGGIRNDLSLGVIAPVQAQIGDIPGAVETARKIKEEGFKALAFARIAMALAVQD